jgi:hypothetical protein
VTGAISSLYESGDQYGEREARPLSFLPSRGEDKIDSAQPQIRQTKSPSTTRSNLASIPPQARAKPHTNGSPHVVNGRKPSRGREAGPSTTPSDSRARQSAADTANTSFPLNDIDYESSPAAVAQELSNLQALRRMSMEVSVGGDPDLPSFNTPFRMPTLAPTSAGDDSASSMYWVPARLHPELAPQAFQTFIDNKVDAIKRRSGDFSLSPGGLSPQGSGSELRRKKSMLSRQIDNSEGKGAEGYQDGAERLERKRSQSKQNQAQVESPNLHELEILVSNLKAATGGESPADEDMPILPAAPGGGSLRRSTHTTYRRGSLRKGERVPPSKRALRNADPDKDEPVPTSPLLPDGAAEFPPISRVQSEPVVAPERSAENFSKPRRPRVVSPPSTPTPPAFSLEVTPSPPSVSIAEEAERRVIVPSPISEPPPKHFVSQIASNGRSTVQLDHIIPQIVESPLQPSQSDQSRQKPFYNEPIQRPERIAPRETPGPLGLQNQFPGGPPTRSARRPVAGRLPPEQGIQTLQHMAAHPSPLPGSSTRTDSLSFIPTLTEDKKPPPESKKPSPKRDASDGSKKPGWIWGSVYGVDDRERKKEEEPREEPKRPKIKQPKGPEKTHEGARLDVLQTAMDGGRARESLAMDRADLRLEEERKKETGRRSADSRKEKEKEPSFLAALFGGGKKKPDRESPSRRGGRAQSPEPQRPALKPDVDYNWTRFSILEERAIYRMAHIKLANPRRALYSQVLLSNFMYSYLAKVQQMHPQIQIPQNPAQKAQQRQQAQQQQLQRTKDQPEEYFQYQRFQEVRLDSPLSPRLSHADAR